MTQDMVALSIVSTMILLGIVPLIVLFICCAIEKQKTSKQLEEINREIREMNGQM